MRALIMALTLSQTFFSVVLADTASGQIRITLQDEQGRPVVGQVLHFVVEGGAVQASCTTTAAGTCTIILEGVPSDASGFIRGTLEAPGYGKRPLIWPAGTLDLALTLTLDRGIQAPVDVLATRVPATLTATRMPHSTQEDLRSTGTARPEIPAPTAPPAPPASQSETPGVPQPPGPRPANRWGAVLLFGFLLALLIGAGLHTASRKEIGA